MSKTGWKKEERDVAKQLGGKRYPANMGGDVDVIAEREFVSLLVQCKQHKSFSWKQLVDWADKIAGAARYFPEVGMLALKRSAGKGKKTDRYYFLREDQLVRLLGFLKESQ
jgi:hypothetical protein